VQRRPAFGIERGAALDQHANDVLAAFHRRQHQRRLASAVASVDVECGHPCERHRGIVGLLEQRTGDRRLPVPVDRVRVCSRRHQAAQRGRVVTDHGGEQLVVGASLRKGKYKYDNKINDKLRVSHEVISPFLAT
jgi:hypothetical protein